MEPARNRTLRSFRSKQDIIRLLAECDQSGQTIKSFCTSRNIAPGTFYSWKQQYKNDNKELPGFAPVKVTPSPSAGLFAEVGGIKIYQPVSPAYLKDLL